MPGPREAELGRLHERLLGGDPVAPVELAERLLPLLRARLAGWAATVDDPHMVPSAIGLVIARYLTDPTRFDPERGGLAAYLAMEVHGDVRNELDSRRRRRRHEAPVAEPVELEPHGRDSTVEEEALDAVDPIGVSPEADKVDPVIGDEVFRTRSSAELPEVAVTFAWARAARPVRVVHGRVVPVKRSQPLLDRTLDLWERALEGLRQLGPDIFDDHLLWSFLADDLDSLIPALLSALYLADEPVPLRALADHAWNDMRGGYVLDDEPTERLATWRWKVAADLDRILQHLELLGAVERIAANDEPATDLDGELPLPTRYLLGSEGMLETGFRLTPLGLWGANRLLRGLGVDAPAVGDLADADVATLLGRCADFDTETCQEELRTWCEARGAEVAAAELVAFLLRTDEPQARMLGFTALGAAGDAGVDAVRTLRGDPELDPYATLWLVDRGLEKQEAVRPEMAAHMLVETCAAVAAQDGPSAVVQMLSDLGPADEQAAIVGDLWRVGSPHAATVLQAVADAHPDKQAARKAAFKLRTSGPRA